MLTLGNLSWDSEGLYEMGVGCMKPKAYLHLLTDKRPKPTEEIIKHKCGFY